LDPDAHRIIGRSPSLYVAHPRNPLHRVNDIDRRVVAQKVEIISAVRRDERDNEQWKRQRFFYGDAEVFDFGWQHGKRLRDSVLYEHVMDGGVAPLFYTHCEHYGAMGGDRG